MGRKLSCDIKRDASSGYESDTESGHVIAAPSRHRRRRDRTQYSSRDLEQLEAFFLADPYPGPGARDRIAAHLAISEDRIHVWFQNRRAKSNKARRRPAPLVLPSSILSTRFSLSAPSCPSHGSPPSTFPSNLVRAHPMNLSPIPIALPVPPGDSATSSTSPADNATSPPPSVTRGIKRPWETPSPPRPRKLRCLQRDFSPLDFPAIHYTPALHPPTLPFAPSLQLTPTLHTPRLLVTSPALASAPSFPNFQMTSPIFFGSPPMTSLPAFSMFTSSISPPSLYHYFQAESS